MGATATIERNHIAQPTHGHGCPTIGGGAISYRTGAVFTQTRYRAVTQQCTAGVDTVGDGTHIAPAIDFDRYGTLLIPAPCITTPAPAGGAPIIKASTELVATTDDVNGLGQIGSQRDGLIAGAEVATIQLVVSVGIGVGHAANRMGFGVGVFDDRCMRRIL